MHNRLQQTTIHAITSKNHNFVITTAVISETPIIVSIMTILFGKMKFEKKHSITSAREQKISDNHGEWINK